MRFHHLDCRFFNIKKHLVIELPVSNALLGAILANGTTQVRGVEPTSAPHKYLSQSHIQVADRIISMDGVQVTEKNLLQVFYERKYNFSKKTVKMVIMRRVKIFLRNFFLRRI